MKKTLLSIVAASFVSALSMQAQANKDILNIYHQYGIKKCDNFIIKNLKFEDGKTTDWNFLIDKKSGGMDGVATEVTGTFIYGSAGDTVKVESTVIQTSKNCYSRNIGTISYPTSCDSKIDLSVWKLENKMDGNDYSKFSNKENDVTLLAKESGTIGNKHCILQYQDRNSQPHEK